jgi:isoleucyl-tRNA synthetase
MARDIVRLVQDLRKNSGLEMEDRIALYLGTDDENLKQAIVDHRAYIGAETLTMWWADAPFDPHSTDLRIEGCALKIALRKITLAQIIH